jgi:hypothetical protein
MQADVGGSVTWKTGDKETSYQVKNWIELSMIMSDSTNLPSRLGSVGSTTSEFLVPLAECELLKDGKHK